MIEKKGLIILYLKKRMKTLGIFLCLVLINFLAFIGMVAMRYFFGIQFLPFFLLIPLSYGWLNRITLPKGVLRWIIASLFSLGLFLVLIYHFAKIHILLQLITHMGNSFFIYIFAGIFIFFITAGFKMYALQRWAILMLWIIVFLLLLGSAYTLLTPTFPPDARQYLESHLATLNIKDTNDFKPLHLLDSFLHSHDVFFIGEYHAVKANYQLRFKFLKYLNQRADVRYYLSEGGIGNAILINHYLRTGNEELLKMMMLSLQGTPDCVQENIGFLKQVRYYNQTIAEEKRIRYIGIDLESQWPLSIILLDRLMPIESNSIPPHINQIQKVSRRIKDRLLKQKKFPRELLLDMKKLMANLYLSLQEKPNIYTNYWDEHFFSFKMIVENCKSTEKYWSNPNRNLREEAQYNNFLKIYHQLPEIIPKKFFGQWGASHIYLRPYEFYERLAGKLQHRINSPVRSRVLSINSLYYECLYRDPSSGKAKPVLSWEKKWAKALVKLTDNPSTLFLLTGDSSPFEKKTHFIESFLFSKSYVTTNYFQFIILIRNSPAATPWEYVH